MEREGKREREDISRYKTFAPILLCMLTGEILVPKAEATF
jgi:hypothetical protein